MRLSSRYLAVAISVLMGSEPCVANMLVSNELTRHTSFSSTTSLLPTEAIPAPVIASYHRRDNKKESRLAREISNGASRTNKLFATTIATTISVLFLLAAGCATRDVQMTQVDGAKLPETKLSWTGRGEHLDGSPEILLDRVSRIYIMTLTPPDVIPLNGQARLYLTAQKGAKFFIGFGKVDSERNFYKLLARSDNLEESAKSLIVLDKGGKQVVTFTLHLEKNNTVTISYEGRVLGHLPAIENGFPQMIIDAGKYEERLERQINPNVEGITPEALGIIPIDPAKEMMAIKAPPVQTGSLQIRSKTINTGDSKKSGNKKPEGTVRRSTKLDSGSRAILPIFITGLLTGLLTRTAHAQMPTPPAIGFVHSLLSSALYGGLTYGIVALLLAASGLFIVATRSSIVPIIRRYFAASA